MTAQRILAGAMLLAGIVDAHAPFLQVHNNAPGQAQGQAKTTTTTETEYYTATVKETVTFQQSFTITRTEQRMTVTVTATQTVVTCPTLTQSSSPTSSHQSSQRPSSTSKPVTSLTTTSSSTSSPPSAVSTPTSCPVPPTCGNLGFDWAYYNNSARNSDTTYSKFHPDAYKSTKPVYVGTTDYVGGTYDSATGAPGPIYGTAPVFQLSYFALNHHAYLYACEGGTYNISIPYANDAVYLWLGAKAYSGWTDDNADAKARYDQPHHIPGSASFTVTLPAGTYVPIRFFYGQAQYGGGFNFDLTAPSGEVLVSDKATDSPYVVRYSCDGVTAPRYLAFGSES